MPRVNIKRIPTNGGNMTNLLDETKLSLSRMGATLDDVVYIGRDDGMLVVPNLVMEHVLNINYDSGYGDIIIDDRLIIVTNDKGTLVRWNSEGSEGWRILRPCAQVGSEFTSIILKEK